MSWASVDHAGHASTSPQLWSLSLIKQATRSTCTLTPHYLAVTSHQVRPVLVRMGVDGWVLLVSKALSATWTRESSERHCQLNSNRTMDRLHHTGQSLRSFFSPQDSI